ncbi:MAG: acylneuraminate cytidylyltransferase [Chloroflexi bacterium]|nr:acylneuraminate cytidylyltransferase [Chloroflexota bacterium]|tara:strand:- start:45894 stop:46661 length:768 start_codon:yes stop_codon:yes gene_type:complete
MNGCIIQARIGSTRLPGKVMYKINERPIIDYLLSQIKHSELIDKIVVATTDQKNDDLISNYIKRKKLSVFRGDEHDVLDRYYKCAKKFRFSTIIRITADNPLIEPHIIDRCIKKFYENSYDYVSNTIKRTFPIGYDVEIFSFEVLENAWKNAKLPSEREHVTPNIIKNNGLRKFNIKNSQDFSKFRITLDTDADLELIKKILTEKRESPILFNDIKELIKNKSSLFDINKHVKHDGYERSIERDKIFLENMKDNA